MSFWAEVRRRKIFQVTAVYAVVAWLLVQVVATVEAPLNLPDWGDTLVIVLLAVGFPVTLIMSWALNLTSEGLVRDTGPSVPGQPSGRRIEYALIGLLALAVAFLFVDDYVLPRAGEPEISATPAGPLSGASPVEVLPKVAVLPCENLSPDPDDAYFAAGIHEEILNQVAKLSSLLVVARSSVLQYAETRPPASQIARDLSAQLVMECSVRYAGNSILVTAQLIDPETDAHVWSETYPGDLTDLSTVFGLQADIARNIAVALEADLSPAEERQLARFPTESQQAYAWYLRATEAFETYSFETERTIGYLDRALEADPGFGLAYAFRGFARYWGFQTFESDLDTELELARQDANRALRIDATIGVAYVVLAFVHEYRGDWATAEVELARARELSPSDALVLLSYADYHLRHLRRPEALELMERVRRVDPSSTFLGPYLMMAGDLEGAYEAFNRRVELSATDGEPHVFVGVLNAVRGDTAAAERELRLGEGLLGPEAPAASWAFLVYAYGRIGRAEDARRVSDQLRARLRPSLRDAGWWLYANLGVGDGDGAFASASRLAQVPAGAPEALGRTWLVFNPFDDPVLERPEFVELRERIRGNESR